MIYLNLLLMEKESVVYINSFSNGIKSDFPLTYKHVIFLDSVGTACFYWKAEFILCICSEDMIFSGMHKAAKCLMN